MNSKTRGILIVVLVAAVFLSSIYATFVLSYSAGYKSGYSAGSIDTLLGKYTALPIGPNQTINLVALPDHGDLNGTFTLSSEFLLSGNPSNNSVNIVMDIGTRPSTGWFVSWEGDNAYRSMFVNLSTYASVPESFGITILIESNASNVGVTTVLFQLPLVIIYHPA